MRDLFREVSDEFTTDDGGEPLTPRQTAARKRLVAALIRDLIDLKKRATAGSIRGQGLSTDRASEWCWPVGGEDQLGEMRHPVEVEPGDRTDIFGWQFRMYFAAPRVAPEILLWLICARKPSASKADDWKTIQNGHIADAKAEFEAWLEGENADTQPTLDK